MHWVLDVGHFLGKLDQLEIRSIYIILFGSACPVLEGAMPG